MRPVTIPTCLVIVCLAVAGATGRAAAQDIPKSREIHVHMKGSRTNPEGPNPYTFNKVLPSSKGICPGHNTEDCYDDVAWLLRGPDLPAGWSVVISPKKGTTKACFPDAPFEIESNQPVSSGPVDTDACKQWDVWPYDLVLQDAAGAEKDRIDPLVVLHY